MDQRSLTAYVASATQAERPLSSTGVLELSPTRESSKYWICPRLTASFSRPSDSRIRRLVTAMVSWLASVCRSAPENRLSRNSWPQLKVIGPVSTIGELGRAACRERVSQYV